MRTTPSVQRAGLELAAAIARLTTSVQLQARVGIATGLVVVGDLIGSGEVPSQAQANKDVARQLHGSTIWANSRTIHAPADADGASRTN